MLSTWRAQFSSGIPLSCTVPPKRGQGQSAECRFGGVPIASALWVPFCCSPRDRCLPARRGTRKAAARSRWGPSRWAEAPVW